MAYDNVRSYIGSPLTIAAQNGTSTASGAIVAGATTATGFVAEPTFICSIGGLVTATPTAPLAGVRAYVLVGTSTSTGAIGFTQSSGSGGLSTFIPSVAISSGSFTIGLVGTGTASATQTFAATSIIVGLAPQFV